MSTIKEQVFVSYSKISCYLNSPVDYYFRYVEKIYPIGIQRPLFVGSVIHLLLEQRAKRLIDPKEDTWEAVLDGRVKEEYEKLSAKDQEDLGDFVEDVRKILRQYDWVYANEKITYLEVEKEIHHSWYSDEGKEIVLIMKVDGIVTIEGKEGQYIVEHKTFKSTPKSLEDAWIDMQTALYAYILNHNYGYDIRGVVWDHIKSVPYSEPKILKNGSYGKQPGTVTLLSFTTDPGEAIIEQVKDNHVNFLNRYVTMLSPIAMETYHNEMLEVAKEIANGGDLKYLSIRKMDQWSAYRPIVMASLKGEDVEYVKATLYKPKEEEKEDADTEVE